MPQEELPSRVHGTAEPRPRQFLAPAEVLEYVGDDLANTVHSRRKSGNVLVLIESEEIAEKTKISYSYTFVLRNKNAIS